MNSSLNSSGVPLPPAFMATTRQKILLKEHHLPESFFELTHPKTAKAINSIGNIAKSFVDFAKKI